MTASSTENTPNAPTGRYLPFVILISTLLLTALISFLSFKELKDKEEAAKHDIKERINSKFSHTIDFYTNVLEGAQIDLENFDNIKNSRQIFNKFSHDLIYSNDYPGIQVVGITKQVSEKDRPTYELYNSPIIPRSETKSEDFGKNGIYQPVIFALSKKYLAVNSITSKNPKDIQKDLVSVNDIETPKQVIGTDLLSDPRLQDGLKESSINHTTTSSYAMELSPIDGLFNSSKGFYIFVPLKSKNGTFYTLYAIIDLNITIKSILPNTSSLFFSLKDSKGNIAYSNHPSGAADVFFSTYTFEIGKSNWEFDFYTLRDNKDSTSLILPWSIAVGGTIVSLIIFFATLTLTKAREQAVEMNLLLESSQSALDRTRAEFESMFTAMADVVVFCSITGHVIRCNAALRATFGYFPETFHGHLIDELYANSSHNRTLGRFEAQYRKRNGEIFIGETQRSAVRNHKGVIIGYLEIIRDISQTIETGDELIASRTRYQTLLEVLPLLVWSCDPLGKPLYFNTYWSEYTGYNNAQSILGGVWSVIHPNDLQKVRRIWEQAQNTGEAFSLSYRIRRQDGQYLWFASRTSPIRTPKGVIQEWVTSSSDIDARVRSEDRARLLAETSRLLSSLQNTDALSDVVKLLGQHLVDACQLYFIDSPQQPIILTNDLPTAFLDHTSLQNMRSEISKNQQFIEKLKPLENIETVLFIPLSIREHFFGWIEIYSRRLLVSLETETIIAVSERISNFLDNRALYRKTEEALKDRQLALLEVRSINTTLELRVLDRTKQLEDANKELESFSYSVSHDLRAPLRHIQGFNDLLKRELGESTTEKAKRYLGIINSSVLRMGNLIDDLLSFSRTSRQDLRFSQVNMNDLVQSVKQELDLELEQTPDRKVEWTIPDLPAVLGDISTLRQVWTNLLSNALKYSRTKDISMIEIIITQTDTEYIFQVKDNGVGFNMQYQNKLFGVFQRLHRPEDFEGTGIGLASVRRIISRHGGRTWAEGILNIGASFYFSLPLEKKNDA